MNLDFLSGIGDAIAEFFDSALVQTSLRAIGIYVVVIWLASAYWAFRDMHSRSANPVLPYLAAALVVGFTPVFFLFGILVYRIVRPQERLGEAYERGLAEEALIAEIEQIEHCATCGRKVRDDWIICPTCRARLKRVCPHCSKLVGLDWSLCAWCGRDFERREAAAVGAVPARPVLPIREPPPDPLAAAAQPVRTIREPVRESGAEPARMVRPVRESVVEPVTAPVAAPLAEPAPAAAVVTTRTRTVRAAGGSAAPRTSPRD